MSQSHFTSEEACHFLGIVPETLYAYVSRGLVRSEAGSTLRGRLYRRSDIEALKQKRELRRRPQEVLHKSLDWGAPILDSALTLIADGRLYYRGKDVVVLAKEKRLSDVALLFWTGVEGTPEPQVTLPSLARPFQMAKNYSDLLAVIQTWLPILGETDPAAAMNDASLLLNSVVRLVLSMASIAARTRVSTLDEIAPALAKSWNRKNAKDWRLIEQALILCVDHELNISSFTARCVASSGSSLYEVVNAAISAFRGFRHGGSTSNVEGLFDEVTKQRTVQTALISRMRRGESIPGFGHPLYADGDPRASSILSVLRSLYPKNPELRRAFEIIETSKEILGRDPNIDFALVTLRRTLQAPIGSAMILFALGRSVGWTGHAMEQYQTAQLIRPRARYIGSPPEQFSSD